MWRSSFAALREWSLRLLGSVSKRRVDAELREELQQHLELAEHDLRARGYTPEEAARLARARHGQPENALERLRGQRGIPWFGVFSLDVRLGLRMLRKFPGLTVIGGLAMTLGFAILTTVFAYFDTVVWTATVPLADGDEVVAIQLWDPENARRSETRVADFERWRGTLRTLEDLGAFRTVRHDAVLPGGQSEKIAVAEMSAAGFRVARISPERGRYFTAADERTEAEPVIVIGHDEWVSRFAASEAAIGQTIRIGERSHTIIGVMPETFGFPINHQYWIPLQATLDAVLPPPPAGAVFGRLRDGTDIATAQAELASGGLLPGADASDGKAPIRLTLVQYADNFVDDTDPRDLARRTWNARLVMLFVSLLLIPPCANIAMLIYARTVIRQEEIAIRTALGASRMRIVAQLFIEMLVLTVLSALLALVAVSVILDRFELVMLRELERLPFWISFDVSANTIAFAGTLALLAALLTGMLPALQSTRNFARPGLSALDPRNRIRLGVMWTTLAVAQIAFSFAALPTAIELAWGTLRPHTFGPGFPAESYLTVRLDLDADSAGMPAQSQPYTERLDAARRALAQTLERDPRVDSRVSSMSFLPGQGGQGIWARVAVEESNEPDSSNQQASERTLQIGAPLSRRMHIDDRYFEILETSLLAGRMLDTSEYRSGSQSVVVNSMFVEAFLAGENPLGRRIRYLYSPQMQGRGAPEDSWFEIVGVTDDRPAYSEGPTVFHPLAAGGVAAGYMMFRTGPDASMLRAQLPAIAADIDPLLQAERIRTLAELYAEMAFGNYIGGLSLIVGSLAVLMLSAAGLYALMSFTVNQRQREIGIRLALGARPHGLLAGIFKTALRQTAIGAFLGILVAALVEHYIPSSRLGGWDMPGIVPGAVAVLLVIGVIAAWGPARRTLAVSPSDTLKQD